MSLIPSPVRCSRASNADGVFLLNGPVTVSHSGDGTDAIANYLCEYLSAQICLDSLAESQIDAANNEGAPSVFSLDGSPYRLQEPTEIIESVQQWHAINRSRSCSLGQFAACLDRAQRVT